MDENSFNEFKSSEAQLFSYYGLNPRSHKLSLRKSAIDARVIECGDGPPMLMVHGGGGIAAHWASLMAQVTGHRIYAVDRPGHGLSGPVNYRVKSLKQHTVSFLSDVLDELNIESVPIVANSMGGLWSLWLAKDMPERVSSLALLGCPALLLDTTAPFPMRLLGVRGLNSLMWSSRKPSTGMMKSIHGMMGHSRSSLNQLPEAYWQATVEAGKLPHYKTAWLTLLERAVGPFGARRNMPFGADDLSQVTQPTLFVWGQNDKFGSPAVGERAVKAMPDARMLTVEGGHLPWLDQPVEVGTIVNDWLAAQRNQESPGPNTRASAVAR